MTDISIAIGCDHAGPKYKEKIMEYFSDIKFTDFGTSGEESVDYPDHAHLVAESVEKGESGLGILICGSGNGVAMSANKHQSIRAALCWTPEIASLAKQHNNANIICIPARFVSEEESIKMVEAFLTTEFEGGRHQRRVEKIAC